MYGNGAIYKTPDEKTIILLLLHGDIFCLVEIVNGKLNIVREDKWEYSASELPRKLEDYEFIEAGSVSFSGNEKAFEKPKPDPEPKPEPKPEPEPKPVFDLFPEPKPEPKPEPESEPKPRVRARESRFRK